VVPARAAEVGAGDTALHCALDYLIVAFQVAPELRARRRREQSANS